MPNPLQTVKSSVKDLREKRQAKKDYKTFKKMCELYFYSTR